ncbi:MAG: hypothetical protein ACRDXC_10870 [Acidimicrobiales bacterium]
MMEEAAHAVINTNGLGGAVEIPADMKAAALQRAMAFEQKGVAAI